MLKTTTTTTLRNFHLSWVKARRGRRRLHNDFFFPVYSQNKGIQTDQIANKLMCCGVFLGQLFEKKYWIEEMLIPKLWGCFWNHKGAHNTETEASPCRPTRRLLSFINIWERELKHMEVFVFFSPLAVRGLAYFTASADLNIKSAALSLGARRAFFLHLSLQSQISCSSSSSTDHNQRLK